MHKYIFFFSRKNHDSKLMNLVMKQIKSTGIEVENVDIDMNLILNNELKAKYKVTSAPTVVKVGLKEREIGRLNGYYPFEQVYNYFKNGKI